MKLLSFFLLGLSAAVAHAQEPPALSSAAIDASAPASLVQDGKLRLRLDDAVRLALQSGAARLDRLSFESAQLNVDRTSGNLYDPRVTGSFLATDSTQRSTVVQEGALERNDTTQSASMTFSQRFATGTRSTLTVGGNRFSTNNRFSFVNPEYRSSLRFQLEQPLWRNAAGRADRAVVSQARHDAAAARATLGAELSTTIERATERYWRAVLASQGLAVRRQSLELAETTYKKNKRMLELGALPPLEIHRSEADVASRKLEVLRGEFDLRRAEEDLRRDLGLDLDPAVAAVPLELVDSPEGESAESVDVEAAVAAALKARPELHALERQIDSRESRVRVAESGTRPALDLVASYSLSGVGGTELHPDTLAVTRTSGLGHAFDQVWGRNFPVYSVNLVLDLPVRNRTTRANLASARIERDRGRIELQERRQEVVLQVRRAADEVAHTREAIALATQARDFSRKTLESEQRKYELGAAELFIVLEQQARLARAELDLLAARVDHQQALTGLDLATGRLLERYKVIVD